MQGNIEAEATARDAADKDLQDQISKEITARTDGDTALQSSADKEVAARTDADSKLQSSIDTEVDVRTKADQSLQEKIDILEGKNAFSNVVVNGTTIKVTSQEDTIELEAGTNIALTADTNNDKITIAVTGKVANAAQADTATNADTVGGKSVTDIIAACTNKAVPAGAVEYFARISAPAGWLKADGSAVSRTDYANLFAAIGTTFGIGDGNTTFNLPDLRGEFVRGFDDGRGVDSSRSLGSWQVDSFKSH
ncbi:MAG: Tail Collar domain protein [Firmicutes bacterium]|nr:Tail Collar domain protein [Bacillota bacterium]